MQALTPGPGTQSLSHFRKARPPTCHIPAVRTGSMRISDYSNLVGKTDERTSATRLTP
jgi:hypothetical protein